MNKSSLADLNIQKQPMAIDSLSKYIAVLGNLHRNQNPKWGAAPHKPVLLLALLDEVERGGIPTNQIELTPELTAGFRAYWRVLVPENTWLEKIANPFRFMVQEGFWELVKNGVPVSTQSLGMNPSVRQLTTEIDGAALAPDLWELLQDRAAIRRVAGVPAQTVFQRRRLRTLQPVIPASPIDYEVERLKAEAQSKFRAKKVSEEKDETGYYVRHALFPKVVKSLYNDSCAACGLNVRTDDGSGLVDAAHIMPFGMFHNDDPRNGIALCKNHHWGFDAGWFTASDEYRIIVSPRLENALSYLTAGVLLLIPSQIEYAPAPEALTWHRSNRYKR